jgi:hypothetical protein
MKRAPEKVFPGNVDNWALNYELQFDFKKGKTLEIMPYIMPPLPYKSTPG